MKINGEYIFDAPAQAVWDHVFADGDFARLVPGCKELVQLEDGEYRGVVSVNMGPIKSDFNVRFRILSLDPPRSGSFEGSAEGGNGSGSGKSMFTLESREDGKTRLQYEAAGILSGALNKIGPRYIESAAKSMIHLGMQKMEGEIKTADLTVNGKVKPRKTGGLMYFLKFVILFFKGLITRKTEGH